MQFGFKNVVSYNKIQQLEGHSQLWDRADLDTSFATLKTALLNPKPKVGNI